MRKGVEIKLSDPEVGVVEVADHGLVMRALNEYLARGVVLSRRVTTMLQEEMGVGDKKKLAEEIASLKKLRESDQQSWVEEKKKLEAEVKRLKLR